MKLRVLAASAVLGVVLTGGVATGSATGSANGSASRAASAARQSDSADVFLSVLPPGNNGNSAGGAGIPLQGTPTRYPDNFVDQVRLYEDLAHAQSGLVSAPCRPPVDIQHHRAASQLACDYFKSEGLTPDKVVSSETLTAPSGGKVTIQRDGWGVPFVSGANRADTMYAFGWAQAEDRLWLLDVLRNVGRGRLTQFLGPDDFFAQIDAGLALTAGYSEDELSQMVANVSARYGSLGSLMLTDIDADVAGINGYIATLSSANADKIPPEYKLLKQGGFPPPAFTRNDVVASAIFIQSLFAVGGGSEAANELLLQQLDAGVGAGASQIPVVACKMWRDLRHANDPEATRTISATFHQSPASLDETCPQTLPAGAAIWDVGSYSAFDGYLTADTRRGGRQASTAVSLHTLTGPSPAAEAIAASASPAVYRPASAVSPSGSPSASVSASAFQSAIPLRNAGLEVEPGPYERLRTALRASGYGVPNSMSNWMAVTGAHTQSGHPIGVMGPQMSYFDPQLTWEVAVHSSGGTALDFNGRGIVFGNLPWMIIGRGSQYGWSATSGDSDLIDTRVSKLCNLNGSTPSRDDANGDGFPDADGYLYDMGDGNGPQCRAFYKRTDSWTAYPTVASVGSGGPAAPQLVTRHILRTHYGPVFATATVNGWPVAISTQRSTFFAELDTATPFALTGTGLVQSAQQFQQLYNGVTGTFNWLYVDSQHVGYIQSGLFPLRDAGQSPDLPVWGDGRFEWAADKVLPADYFSSHGGSVAYPSVVRPVAVNGGPLAGGYYEWQNFLPMSAHPQVIDPAQGYIVSWNNSPATGWWAADNHYNWSAIHRVDTEPARFQSFIDSGRKFDFANVVEIMADSGYTDLRGQALLPLLIEEMQLGSLTDTQQQVIQSMQQWLADGSAQWISGGSGLGAWRRDRDGDGFYDYRPQVVLMDAWYQHLEDSLTPQLAALAPADNSTATGCSNSILLCRYDAPRGQGSAYEYGWYQIMYRLLENQLDPADHTAYRALKCAGTGVAADCRNAILTALDGALSDLGGWDNRANWDGSVLANASGTPGVPVETYDQIIFTDFSLLADPPMEWVNRPTFQQVVEVVQ